MKWQSSREEEEEEEALFLEGVKFHATHTRDRLTASATRISPRQRAEMRKGGLGRATSPLKVPGKLPET